jgi:glycosyltransferase involved in cell wall biosynthesis
MLNTLVSVIIPVYDCERYLAEAIESVLAQTYNHIEIIVVDDGSTDRTSEIAQSYREVNYISQSHQGVSVARNVGIAATQGEVIAFIDADDLWTSNKLCVQIHELLKQPNFEYNICKYKYFLEPGVKPPSELSKDIFLKIHTGYIPSALVALKTVFSKVGLFDPRYRIGEDFDWFVRAKEATIPFQILPQVLLKKRHHAHNLCNEALRDRTHLSRIFRESIKRKLNKRSVNIEQREV